MLHTTMVHTVTSLTEHPAEAEIGEVMKKFIPVVAVATAVLLVGDVAYAQDDAHKDRLMKERFNGSSKVEISRFKGLGEMPVAQLKATTMSPKSRQMLRIEIPEGQERHTHVQIENLMGRKPELRLKFIQDHATEVEELDV